MIISRTQAILPFAMLFLLGATFAGCRVMDARNIPSAPAIERGLSSKSQGKDSQSPTTGNIRLVSFAQKNENAEKDGTENSNAAAGISVNESLTTPPAIKTLDSYLHRALSSHPKILAARARATAAKNRIVQATALADPMIESMFWPVEANSQQLASGRMTNQLDLSQEIPLWEKRRTKGAIAERELQIALAEADQAEREIAESVRIAYYELWFAMRAMEIISNNRAVASELVHVAQTRYQVEGSQQDVIRAELEVEKLDQQLLELSQQRAAAQAELAAAIQEPTAANIEVETSLPTQNLPAQLDQLIAQAEQSNPELQGLAWQIERDQANQRLACLQWYPDFKLGMQYGMMTANGAISPVADGIDNISFSAGVTLPIWREKIRAGIGEATAQRVNSIRLLEAEQLTIAGNLRRLFAEANLLVQQRTLYASRITPKAEQALEVATAEYTVGNTTFAQVVDNYTEVLTFRLEAVRLEASLAATLARIQRAVGCD